MSKAKISIVGLGLIGSSMGLALKEQEGNYQIIGHDSEPLVTKYSRKMGAVDDTSWNLITACDGADLIILAVPLAAMRKTLEAIAPDLKPGAIVSDTATLKAPVMAMAEELIPDGVSFIGGNPILLPGKITGVGVEAAASTLLQGG